MTELRLSPEAEAELDDIWIRIAQASGSPDIANRVVEGIVEHFWILAKFPYIGRQRDQDLRPGLRSLATGNYIIIHRIAEEDVQC